MALTVARLLLGPLALWMATHGVAWFRRLDIQVDVVFNLVIVAYPL